MKKARVALALLSSTLGCSCTGPEGARLQDPPSIAERRLYGSAINPSQSFSPALFDPALQWDDDPTLKGIGQVRESPRREPPSVLSEDRLPSTLQEPWYSFPAPAPFWSAGLPGLPNSGLFGGIPPQFR